MLEASWLIEVANFAGEKLTLGTRLLGHLLGTTLISGGGRGAGVVIVLVTFARSIVSLAWMCWLCARPVSLVVIGDLSSEGRDGERIVNV